MRVSLALRHHPPDWLAEKLLGELDHGRLPSRAADLAQGDKALVVVVDDLPDSLVETLERMAVRWEHVRDGP